MKTSQEKITALRNHMQQHKIDFYFVPSTDAHNNEYLPDGWKRRSWLTHFTGSAGDALIGTQQAFLWTDPRYFLQAEEQLDPDVFMLMKQTQGMAPPIAEWLETQAAGKRVGVDPKLISYRQAKQWQAALEKTGGELVSIENNLVDAVWADQPSIAAKPITLWPEKCAGKTAFEKIVDVRSDIAKHNATTHVVTMLDAIAWLLNIRGSDIAYNPLVISYAAITKDKAVFFVDEAKLTDEDRVYFKTHNIEVHPYDQTQDMLLSHTDNVLLDDSTASWWVAQQLKNANIICAPSPITLKKAIKNPTELAGMREAHRKDGLALCRLLYWLDKHGVGKTELLVSAQATKVRESDPDFRGLSFNTIAGFAAHGAIIHYAVTEETSIAIDDQSLLLVDSGGQYEMGTTDVTRTVHLGTPTAEQKRHYTLALKGHLALRHLYFPDGTTGEQINMIAHQPLWQEGLDYGHGTGHGVGCYLCVHEGPQRIAGAITKVALKPGMVVSNEPGVYFTGQYGIRIENLVEIKEVLAAADSRTGNGPFYGFSDLTLAPYARNLIDTDLLTAEEIAWINDYHQTIADKLLQDLEPDVQTWLKEQTKPL